MDLDELIHLLERRALFMVNDLVREGVAEAEAHQAARPPRHRPSHAYWHRDRNPVVRAKGPATGDMKVNQIERVTFHRWTDPDRGFFSDTW
jgi:hypothetical protein